MPHFEDDDPPIKSHPASAEYRANFDRIFNDEASTVDAALIDEVLAEPIKKDEDALVEFRAAYDTVLPLIGDK